MGMLAVWGLDDEAELLYRALLRHPDRTLDDLAELLERTADQLTAPLAALGAVGLVRLDGDRPAALPPTPTITGMLRTQLTLVEARRAELESLRANLSSLAADHLVGQTRGWSKLPFEVLAEADAFAAMEDLQRSTSGEVLACHRVDEVANTPASFIEIVRTQLAAGRPMRAVYPSTVVEDEEKLDYVLHWASCGEQVRLGPVDIPEIDVFDHIALVSGQWEGVGDGSMIVVHAPAMVAIVRELFERIWARAVPLRRVAEGTDSGLADGEREILRLLTVGAKDEAIARQLGVSLRTVRRRVADLMADLGAGTRFQAGMEAVRRGWV